MRMRYVAYVGMRMRHARHELRPHTLMSSEQSYQLTVCGHAKGHKSGGSRKYKCFPPPLFHTFQARLYGGPEGKQDAIATLRKMNSSRSSSTPPLIHMRMRHLCSSASECICGKTMESSSSSPHHNTISSPASSSSSSSSSPSPTAVSPLPLQLRHRLAMHACMG